MKYIFLIIIIVSGQINASFIRHWHEYQAHKAYEQKKYDTAISIYTTMLQNDAYDPVVNYNLGTAFYEKKQFEMAQNYFNRAVQYSKNAKLKQEALFDCGNALQRQGLLQQAIDAYEKVLELNPDNQPAKQNLQYVKQLLEQEKQKQQSDNNQQQSDENKSDDKQDGGDKSDSGKKQKNTKNNQKDRDQNDENQSSLDEQNQEDDNQKNDQSDQKKSEQSDGTKNSKQNQNADEKNNTNDEQDATKDLKKSKKDSKNQKHEKKSKDQRDQNDSKEQQSSSDLKKNQTTQQQAAQQDDSDSGELTDAYAQDVLQDFDDKRLDKHGAAVMQSVAQQEENMQKAVLKMNVSKKGDVQRGQKNW